MPAKKPAKKSPKKTARRKSAGPKAYSHYHKDGTLWAKGQLKDGIMVGYWEWFRKTGSVMRTGHFDEQGRQTGDWTTYAADGRVVKVTHMKPKA